MIIPADKKEGEFCPQASSQLPPSNRGSTLQNASLPSSSNPEEVAPADQDANISVIPAHHESNPANRSQQNNEPDEETQLLPPSYLEAVSQSGKNTRNKRRLYIIFGIILVLLIVGGCAGILIVKRSRDRGSADSWKRGGLDGKGKFDHRWQHPTPLLPSEIQPRECDLFSEPRLIDSWRSGTTALPIFESFAEFMFPLDDSKNLLQKFWIHVRGSRANGMVQVIGPGTEISEFGRPPPGKLKVVVRVTAENTTGLNDWHVCKAGAPGEEGVVIVGLYDGKRPVSSPWLEGYTKFVVNVIFPHDIDFPGSPKKEYLLDTLAMSLENMAVEVQGDLVNPGLAMRLDVLTKNGGVAMNSLSVVDARIETKNANVALQRIFARDTIILVTEKAYIACAQCIANSSYIVAHNDNGKVTGSYRAGGAIDLVTSGQDIDGEFHSPRIWVKNEDASIHGRFSGLLPENKNGALTVLTSFGRVDASIDFAHLRLMKPAKGSSRNSNKVPIRLGTTSSEIEATISHLPPGVAIALEAEVSDGGITVIAPDQLQTKLDLTVEASSIISIDLGNDEASANKRLITDRHPVEEGKWKGSLHGSLTYRRIVPSPVPLAMSSLNLLCTQFVYLQL
ncbi:hypothetical protein QFC19_003283 [Naganishia cerealis]|uniref:Uncharacterized protein n=1 Tax=Naganishia cerealis TaxID=610337 RepID=A0ACC2W3W0_9TREE|nr:hypothetical protein QFC19_003283 [Naganishia cerealis]